MLKDTIHTTGLVLEGGGMRGVFTIGVLDYLMDNNIYFPYTVGVSAGACNGLSYASKQRGRAKYSTIDLLAEYKYIGLRHIFKHKSIMNMELLFETFPEEILPYDYDTYFSSNNRIEVVATNCLTGKAEYLEEKADKQRLLNICRASSSLPFACPIVYESGIPMLDGGICDSIPLVRSMEQGYEKNLVILTRNKGFRKPEKEIKIPAFLYRKYPEVRKALKLRNAIYNQQVDLVERLETEGQIHVIRPNARMEVDRMEQNPKKLENLYDEGYKLAKALFEK